MTKILQLNISLEGITPKIWRRFLVKENITFQELHDTIQIVMGWDDYHMFEFQINDVCISAEEEGHNLAESSFKKLYQSPEFIKMLEQTKLENGFASLNVDKLNTILKEQEQNKNADLVPTCLEGERAGPPEDCGSYPGYYELMRIKKNKKHPEYKERIKEWLSEDFDFEHFDIEEINKELLKLIKVDGRNRYWVPK